jgi:hypothetical protein
MGIMATSTKAQLFDWRKEVGARPTDQNLELFHSYVEMATTLLEEFSSAEFIYSEVRQVCQPAYLFSVVCDMRSDKLSMRIYVTDSGLKAISIHKV